MMEGYWPTAGDQPNATKHDIEHSRWYNSVAKVVASRSMKGATPAENLIDDYWLFINPVLLERGIPLFKDIKAKAALRLVASNVFSSGIVCLHYEGLRAS